MPSDVDDIRARLEGIAEELADLGLALLREALDDPDRHAEAAVTEKQLARARRSVEKAAQILAPRFDDPFG